MEKLAETEVTEPFRWHTIFGHGLSPNWTRFALLQSKEVIPTHMMNLPVEGCSPCPTGTYANEGATGHLMHLFIQEG